jgi:hypothetical protein
MKNFFASSTSRIRTNSTIAVSLTITLICLTFFSVVSFDRDARAANRASTCRIPARRPGQKSVAGRKRIVRLKKIVGSKSNRHTITVRRVVCQPIVKRSSRKINRASIQNTPVRTTPIQNTPIQNTPIQNTPTQNTPTQNTPTQTPIPRELGLELPTNESVVSTPVISQELRLESPTNESVVSTPVVPPTAPTPAPVVGGEPAPAVTPNSSAPAAPSAAPAAPAASSSSTQNPPPANAESASSLAKTVAREVLAVKTRRRPTVTSTTRLGTSTTIIPTTTTTTKATTTTTIAPTTTSPSTTSPTTTTPTTTTTIAPTTTTATTSVTSTTTPPVVDKPTAERLFTSYAGGASVIGLPWAGDARSRLQVTDHSDVDYVFTATETSSLVSVTAEIVGNNPTSYAPCPATTDEDSCYSAGHGGTIRLDIYANDPGTNNPSGTSLGSHTWNQPMNGSGYFSQAGNDQGSWQGPLALSPAPSLVAGNVYHAVWTNPHANAATNWYGLNQLSLRGIADPFNGRAQQPVLSSYQNDARFRGRSNPRHIHETGNTWRSCSANPRLPDGDDCWNSRGEFYSNVPVVQYKYGNGKESGNGYVLALLGNATAGSSGFGLWAPLTNGVTKTRQVFTVPRSVTIDQIGARINPVSGGTARLLVRRESDDSLVNSADIRFSVPGPLTPGYQTGVSGSDNGISLQAALTPTVLAAGKYYIEFDRADGAVYVPEVMRPLTVLQGGVLPAWGPGTRWEDGELQNFNGKSWVNVPNPDHADAFVYLRVVG